MFVCCATAEPLTGCLTAPPGSFSRLGSGGLQSSELAGAVSLHCSLMEDLSGATEMNMLHLQNHTEEYLCLPIMYNMMEAF